MYVLQSNGYISEDSLIWFEEILHLIGRCLVRCRDCLCNVFLPSRSIVLSTLMHIYMLEKKRLIEMKRYIFKGSGFLQRNATYRKGILLLLKECYTLWMKVSVCKACSCHLELVKRRMHVWSSLVVIYSVFTAFSGLGKRPKVEGSFSYGLNHYLRETLQRGWGTWRYVNYT